MLCGTAKSHTSKRTRVIGKLANKAVISEQEKNPSSPFDTVDLSVILTSLDGCLRAMKGAQHLKMDTELKSVKEMAKMILIALLKTKRDEIRKTVDLLMLQHESIQQLLSECEKELQMPSSTLASLIRRISESNGYARTAAIVELRAFKTSNPDIFQLHLSNLSDPFQEFILEQLSTHNKETNEQQQHVDVKIDQRAHTNDSSAPTSKEFLDLKARIEALRQKKNDG